MGNTIFSPGNIDSSVVMSFVILLWPVPGGGLTAAPAQRGTVDSSPKASKQVVCSLSFRRFIYSKLAPGCGQSARSYVFKPRPSDCQWAAKIRCRRSGRSCLKRLFQKFRSVIDRDRQLFTWDAQRKAVAAHLALHPCHYQFTSASSLIKVAQGLFRRPTTPPLKGHE